jgi:hypothetical protein
MAETSWHAPHVHRIPRERLPLGLGLMIALSASGLLWAGVFELLAHL